MPLVPLWTRPDYCGTDRQDCDALWMTLVVEYRLTERAGEDVRSRVTNTLQSFLFGPVGE